MSGLTYATITIISIILCISRACNYVGDAIMIDQNTGYEDRNQNLVPVGVCRTKKMDSQYESEMFVCAPWNIPYYFRFSTADCTGSFPNISSVISSEYECNSNEACNVFKVKSSEPADANTCALGTSWEEVVFLADRCWVESDNDNNVVTYKSSYAECDNDQNVKYDAYQGIACDGEPIETIEAQSEQCIDKLSDDGLSTEQMYIELLECGTIAPPANSEACSKVVGGAYREQYQHEGNTYYQNRSMTGPMGYDMCTNQYENGVYKSQLVYCSETLNMGFVAEWVNRSAPTRCNTEPDSVSAIEDPSYLACNEAAGPCEHMFLRISKFEDPDGNAECTFGNDWDEKRILTDQCFYMDGDTGPGGRSDCSLSTNGNPAEFTLTQYADIAACYLDTAKTGGQSIPFENNECYSFDGPSFGTAHNGPGNWSYFQALECKGTLINDNDIRPDCNFVENARWYDPNDENMGPNNMRGDDMPLTLPIGSCDSSQRDDGVDAGSKMFLCTPWDTVVVAVWNDVHCGAGTGEVYIAEVMSTDYQCGLANCDMVQVELSPIFMDDVQYCANNATSFDQKSIVQGCTDGESDGGYGSSKVVCDDNLGQLDFSVFGVPGCIGTPSMMVVGQDGGCAAFGDDPSYIDLMECGTPAEQVGNDCSYIVNPTWFDAENNETRVRDGAFPLTSEICAVSHDNGRSSAEMYFCDYASQLSWYATWNNSRGCGGEPTTINRIWSGTQPARMRCSSNDKNKCAYVRVSTSESTGDVCQPNNRIEQSARMINMCWPSAGGDGSDGGSWKVDCNGDTAEVFVYGVADFTCSAQYDKYVEIEENGCSEFNENDGEMWFQVHECTEPADPTQSPSESPTTKAPTVAVVEVDVDTSKAYMFNMFGCVVLGLCMFVIA